MYFLKSLVTLILIRLVLCSQDDSKLVAVVQIFRHGHRTPLVHYENDPYADKSYWDGLASGQLTNVGKRQMFELGCLTGERYSSFLPKRYNRDTFNAQSTDMDRTLMSGQTFLYGLFPASGDQIWRYSSDWQPIPLHPASSNMFFPTPTNCPAYANFFSNIYNDKEFQQIDAKYSELLAYFSKHSGNNVTRVFDIWVFYDCLRTESEADFLLPDWTFQVYPEPLKSLSGILCQTMTKTTKAKRLYTGTFLNYVVEYFETMVTNTSSSQKYQVFSGHDSNIAAILNSFEAFEPPYPPSFASTIWIELRQKKGSYYVNVWSKDENKLSQISVNGCSLNCPLKSLKIS